MQQHRRTAALDLNELDFSEKLRRWVAFCHDPRWSRVQKYELLRATPSPQAFIYTYRARSLNPGQLAAIASTQTFLRNANHHCVVYGEPSYPQLVAETVDPPLVLYAIGNLELLTGPCVSIVGSRRPTELGMRATQVFAAQLSDAGITIVSGLALGVDGGSHTAALRAGGNTIAVLACGADVVYPARHRALYENICARGLVLSEYLPNSPARPYRFPERNRLVSSLSLGTLIVEAADNSGTLITARFCIEQNRELFVVPGSYFSRQYVGSHRLIQQGANLVTSHTDVLVVLEKALQTYLPRPLTGAPASFTPELSKTFGKSESRHGPAIIDIGTQCVLDLVGREAMSTDLLVSKSGLPAGEVSAMLLALELEGLVFRTEDGRYYRAGAPK